MADYRFTPEAEADLTEIWIYIARNNPEAADRVENSIHDACAPLSRAPNTGQVRRDFARLPVRFWTVQPFPNYLISTGLTVIRLKCFESSTESAT
jgi:plasmid stabilization system protein ParE